MTPLRRLSPFLVLEIFWIVLPIIFTEPFGLIPVLRWLESSQLGAAPFLIVFLVVLESFAIASMRWRQMSLKKVALRLLLGWLIQSLSILLLWSFASRVTLPVVLLVAIMAFLSFVIYLVLFGLYLGAAWLGKKTAQPFFRSEWFPIIILSTLSILWVGSLWNYETKLRSSGPYDGLTPGISRSGDSTFDRAEVSFRSLEKTQTQLGRLPRPLKILQTPNGFIGLTLKDEQIPLSMLDVLGKDPIDRAFFDVYSDKVYVKRFGSARIYDLATASSTSLPAPILDALQTSTFDTFLQVTSTPSVVDIRGSAIALMPLAVTGATGEIAIYDLTTGARVGESIYLGYDNQRLFLFWVDGKGYRLYLDGERSYGPAKSVPTGDYPRIGPSSGASMYLYLDDYDQPFRHLTHDEILDGLGKVVFGASDWYTQGKTPIAQFHSSFSKERSGSSSSKFSVRSLSRLADGRMALEIEGSLLLIDLTTRQVEGATDPVRIRDLYASASLLSTDDENGHYFSDDCGPTAASEALLSQKETKFLFCLK